MATLLVVALEISFDVYVNFIAICVLLISTVNFIFTTEGEHFLSSMEIQRTTILVIGIRHRKPPR